MRQGLETATNRVEKQHVSVAAEVAHLERDSAVRQESKAVRSEGLGGLSVRQMEPSPDRSIQFQKVFRGGEP